MALVTVYVQTIKEFEVEIDDNLLKLDLNREKTMFENNTEYEASFVNDKAADFCLADLEQFLCTDENSEIVCIQHNATGSYLYDK